MSSKKLYYETPETCFVELAGVESLLLTVSTGATLPDVGEVYDDYVF